MSGEIRFDGDVVIVTGGAGGIGKSQAVELAQRGARVVVNDLGGSPRGGGSDPAMAQAVADDIVASGGEAVASGDPLLQSPGVARVRDQEGREVADMAGQGADLGAGGLDAGQRLLLAPGETVRPGEQEPGGPAG